MEGSKVEVLIERLKPAVERAVVALLAARNDKGYWVGELAPSALATATAVCALAILQRGGATLSGDAANAIESGLDWLARNVNEDGGWGDTPLSFSNISTTALCWAAYGAVQGADGRYGAVVAAAEKWIIRSAGGLEPARLAAAIVRRYGKDRTFAVPILTACALSGRLGKGRGAWRFVPQLPFELAALPVKWFAAVRLPVVSYALPALIAMGHARHHELPSRNPVLSYVRDLTRERTLALLKTIQPSSGGFLEAVPLTAFVTMSLAGCGYVDHPVVRLGADFLRRSQRADGSWAVDSNLATWLTTLSVNALAGSRGADGVAVWLDQESRRRIATWLLDQQFKTEHPYTRAAPGGWAWTNLPGGVPDADDTAGALIALHNLGERTSDVLAAAESGIRWLIDLQNDDGGIPTFCRGWTNLPFDRSGPDLTAHAVRAWVLWRDEITGRLRHRLEESIGKALRYLGRTMREDGTWIPLWFGNQWHPQSENPVYGTSRVVEALRYALAADYPQAGVRLGEGTRALVRLQLPDGSWNGGGDGGPPSIEETALAVTALAGVRNTPATRAFMRDPDATVGRGVEWLLEQCKDWGELPASPIGFYFANLWYYERLYPLIFATGALLEAKQLCSVLNR